MRCLEVWADRLLDKDGVAQAVHAVAWMPDGAHVLAAVGSQVLVYSATDGQLADTLRGHRDVIYALSVAHNGARLASGGADKTVVVWNAAAEGGSPSSPAGPSGSSSAGDKAAYSAAMKYTHNDSIACLAFNPVSGSVCSGTASEFGLWNPETKSVTKYKISSKITCCAWSRDGQFLALGLFKGSVSVRNKLGEEVGLIERGKSPIWSLQWNPKIYLGPGGASTIGAGRQDLGKRDRSDGSGELLVVADWDQSISFYRPLGQPVGAQRSCSAIGDPTCISHTFRGDCFAVSGTSGSVQLWTSDGIRIGTLLERPDEWIWSCAFSSTSNHIAIGTQEGLVSLYQVTFQTVHALHHDRYVYRTGLTDIVVQHLGIGQSCRLQCRDHVKKVSIYKDKIAVQLPTRVLVYELASTMLIGALGGIPVIISSGGEQAKGATSPGKLEYRIKDKVPLALDCNLLVITSAHVLFCIEKSLEMYDFTGKHERTWKLSALIRYIKVTGGPPGREQVVVGMRDGWCYQVFLDNPFPVPLMKQHHPVRCIDINRTRTKIAVVDDSETCFVYELSSVGACNLLFQEPNASSVAWNTDHDDLLCFSGKNHIVIKASTFPTLQQPHEGFIVGFKSSKLYSLHQYVLTGVDVPLATCIYQYMDRRELQYAFQVASLGVGTERDWRALGWEALEAMQFTLSQKCFARIKDYRSLEFVKMMNQACTTAATRNEVDLVLADILAARGKLERAAELLISKNQAERAVTMYTELMMYEYALRLAKECGIPSTEILKHKAELLRDKNDFEAAADTYLQVGDVAHAVKVLIQSNAAERLAVVIQSFGEKMEHASLAQCASFFRQTKKVDLLAQVLMLMGDFTQLINLHIQQDNFDAAFAIAREKKLLPLVYLPYAQYLLLQDNFEKAQENFRLAGRIDLSARVLRQMLDNAIAQECYLDAARHALRLSQVLIGSMAGGDTTSPEVFNLQIQRMRQYKYFNDQADLLYHYHYVYQYLSDPFTPTPVPTLLNMARFLAMRLNLWQPNKKQKQSLTIRREHVSRARVLYAMAKLSNAMGAKQTGSEAVNRLQSYRVPDELLGPLDYLALSLLDRDDVSSSGGKLRSKAEEDELLPICYACSAGNAFAPGLGECASCHVPFVWSFHHCEPLPVIPFYTKEKLEAHEIQAILGTNLTKKAPAQDEEEDPMLQYLSINGVKGIKGNFIQVDKETLARFPPSQVIALPRLHQLLKPACYYVVVPNVLITACKGCQRLFHADDYEYLAVMNGGCPLCGLEDCN